MQERVRRGLTLADCESHLHIRAKFLAAIEDDRDEDLPEPAYARIFARSYASYLELDPVALARELDRRTGDTGWRDHETVDAAPRDAGHLDELGGLRGGLVPVPARSHWPDRRRHRAGGLGADLARIPRRIGTRSGQPPAGDARSGQHLPLVTCPRGLDPPRGRAADRARLDAHAVTGAQRPRACRSARFPSMVIAMFFSLIGRQDVVLPPGWTSETNFSALGRATIDATAPAGPDAKVRAYSLIGDHDGPGCGGGPGPAGRRQHRRTARDGRRDGRGSRGHGLGVRAGRRRPRGARALRPSCTTRSGVTADGPPQDRGCPVARLDARATSRPGAIPQVPTKATAGIEPAHGGFADRSVPTSPRRHDGTGPSEIGPGVLQERVKGLEPSTFCMASRRSSQLSYTRSGTEQTTERVGPSQCRRGAGRQGSVPATATATATPSGASAAASSGTTPTASAPRSGRAGRRSARAPGRDPRRGT